MKKEIVSDVNVLCYCKKTGVFEIYIKFISVYLTVAHEFLSIYYSWMLRFMVQHFDCNLKVIEQKPLFGRQQHSLWTTLSKIWPSLRIKAVILKTFF